MPQTVTRPSGLQVTIPDTFAEPEDSAPGAATSGWRSFDDDDLLSSDLLSVSSRVDAELLKALSGQHMQIVDDLTVPPALAATPLDGRRGADLPPVPDLQEIEIDLPITEGEQAIVLLEQDGLYSWHFPSERTTIAPAIPIPGQRGALENDAIGDAGATRAVKFRISVTAEQPPASDEARRGFFTEMIYGRVRAIVLKFVFEAVGGLAVAEVMKRLEARFTPGLCAMDTEDPKSWSQFDNLTGLGLPTDRPVRLLLFLHGTFSSTVGSFGGLCATDAGRRFLTSANAHYDAVIGFDHPTLSQDPEQNARDLLARLRLSPDLDLDIDAVTFSRGGLVLRSLTELVLPNDDYKARFRSVTCVAVTNGGTQLAMPDNWHRLADLYVNLAAGAAKGIAILAPGNPLPVVFNEVMQGLGAFVKFLASHAIAEGAVPGLAAMMPKGSFIRNLNQIQTALPGSEDISYYAITSQFDARLNDGAESETLPRRLLVMLADGFLDQLMGEENDLVVNISSTMVFDAQAPDYWRDCYPFGSTARVYHLNYFVQPEVVAQLEVWLAASDK